ncbi:MAG TPA: flagellar basal-body MS-ring/collar protein FliF [Steroidobacteraceae bacterium]|jgi:flagellar M-ring protein FliF|nr:flagellar basal-body MS-ring/collar protein FliF [Steroidobacteraceae bacterium]
MSAEAAALPGYASRLPASLKPLLLLIGIAAAVAAGVMVVLWSRGPSYSLLYTNLSAEDQAQVASALEAAGIPYRIEGTNGMSVPAEKLNDARLKLAGQGLPEGSGGFANIAKDPGFGVSQFMEGARYQHALETELARTIASLRPVDGARVHLAVPRESAFVRDRQPASASVFVQLKAGKRLEQEQIQSIINLVASSIPELDASHVTVVDQQGRLLSAPQTNSELAQRERQFELTRRLEEDYAQRIEALLTPFVGPGRVRAQVVAQVDTSVTEEAREQYKPDSQVVRSEQTTETTSRDGSGAQGVPGSLSNQPPTPGTALPPNATTAAPAAAGAANPGAAKTQGAAVANAPTAGPDNTSRSSTRNYEIDRTLAYTKTPSGRLQRLTVAVLIDNLRTTGADGKTKSTPLTPQQLEHVTQLVKDAVGFNAERGDSVNVVNTPFREEATPPAGELEQQPIWEQPFVRDIAKIVAGLIVLLVLVLAVLRPLTRGLLSHTRAAAPQVVYAPDGAAAGGPGGTAPRVANGTLTNAPPLAYEQQLAQARTLVGQDPKRVAQVVRTWVAQDE